MSDYPAFPKIPRLRRSVVITEKIDGTNALIQVNNDGTILAGSRNRWLTPESDNFGFARWVAEHEDELRELGPGRHYGEWWGAGIQRRYGLDHKRFSLFNTARWENVAPPSCCHVVPVLATGTLDGSIDECLAALRERGSVAAPGFMAPEGVVVFHTASRSLFKVLLEGDDLPKTVAA